ncbi:MAG: DUF3105 domain-containing protein [Polyangiaceae bacterium]
MRKLVALLTALCAAPGCGSDEGAEPGGAKDAGPDVNYDPVVIESSQCGAVRQQHPTVASPHVAECSELTFTTDPPTSGPHYGTWAAFEVYSVAVPYGYLVHAMEHGAVVVFYNCESDCSTEVSAAEKWASNLPLDPKCAGSSAKRRLILAPSPTLPSRWAAAAWGATLRASCFEAEVFEDFYQGFYDKAPESLCADGADLKNDDGGLIVPPNCGQGDGGDFDGGGPNMDSGTD